MIKKIKPISRIVKIEAEINKIVGEVFFQKKELLGLDEGWIPCIDVSENENDLKVKIELPGVTQKDVTLLLHSNRLEIKGVKRESQSQGRVKYLQLEREFGTFRRFVFLPEVVIPDKARAALEKGVLTITLKKPRPKKDKEIVLKIQSPKA